jgi:hypothetical protein
MKKQIFAFALIAFMSPLAMAGHVGTAGCGLGNMVFHKENQILAATLNGTGGQVFAITSGTSACNESGQLTQMVMFVESNRLALSNEAARGHGETLSALSDIMGCSDSAMVGRELKQNYRRIFESNGENSIAISNSIRATLSKDERVARTCMKLS